MVKIPYAGYFKRYILYSLAHTYIVLTDDKLTKMSKRNR